MSSAPESRHRLASIDTLRGLVMVIMALDHTREYFHSTAQHFQPENLAHSSTAIFLTRWITHLCAPTFMLTAGLGAFFWLQRGRTPAQLTRFLVERGLMLALLEVTALRLAFTFNFFSGPVLLTVLWALGWSMVALAFLSRLPIRVLAPLSVMVIALHNLTDPVKDGWIWNVLHRPGLLHFAGIDIHVAYPLIPWIFVMAVGFCLGPVMQFETAKRRKTLIQLGGAATLAFILIRALNVYGDPRPWAGSLLSFLNATKYPPSLDFLLMTLGPALLLLALFDVWSNRVLVVYGRAPLFYFLGHLYLIHVLTVLFAGIRYGAIGWIPDPQAASLPGYGYRLAIVYIIWILVVTLMYPACRWYTGRRAA